MKMLMLGLWLIVGGFVADGIVAGVFSPWWGIALAAWPIIVKVDGMG